MPFRHPDPNNPDGATRAAQLRRAILLQNFQEFGKRGFTEASPNPSREPSPKLSGIWEAGLNQGKIHTALIWQKARSEFGSGHLFPPLSLPSLPTFPQWPSRKRVAILSISED